MIAIICALLGGVLFFFSVELNTVWPLMWIAPVPLLWLAYGPARTWHVFAASFAAYAIGQFNLFEAYWLMAPVFSIVIAITAAIYAATMLFARAAQRHLPATAAVLAFPLLWTSVEYINARISAYGSFGAFAYSQVPAPVFIQSASLTGLWSVTFLICAVASALALLLSEGRRATAPAIAAAVLFVANLAFGLARLAAPSTAPVLVAAIGNGETSLPSTEAAARRVSQDYVKAVTALAAHEIHTVVLPEEIAELKPEWRNAIDGFISTAEATGSRIVVGYREVAETPRNVAFTFSRDGTARYTKRHLIPGLEPLSPGLSSGLLGAGRAVAICKDMDFEDTIRRDAQLGIHILFVPAWDFGRDGEAHANIAIMRGVENGFAMVRAARNGLLTITDAQGRVTARATAASSEMTTIVGSVPEGPGPTLYTRIGDVFAWACAAGALALAAWIFSRSRWRPHR
jgi:apolipoprotein N-acyltransferase